MLPDRFPEIDSWVELLDDVALESLTVPGQRPFEGIVSELLGCGVEFRGIETQASRGWLVYEPHDGFRRTDCMKDLIAIFGFEVRADSYFDAYERWIGANA